MIKLSKFDAAKYLDNQETIVAYLNEALEFGDPEFICHALDTIARAKGMTNVAKATGLGRESLYKALSGNAKPEFDTVRKVIHSFGLKLVAEPIEAKRAVSRQRTRAQPAREASSRRAERLTPTA